MSEIDITDADLAVFYKAESQNNLRLQINMCDMVQYLIIGMQCALIDAELSGPEAAIKWLENSLLGPGMLPDIEAARALGGAQAYCDAEHAKHEAFRAANPAPKIDAPETLEDATDRAKRAFGALRRMDKNHALKFAVSRFYNTAIEAAGERAHQELEIKSPGMRTITISAASPA